MSTSDLLGVKVSEHDPVRLVEQLRSGLPAKSLTEFKRETGLNDDSFAKLLAIGGRTLSRLKSERARRLSPELSDRLYAIASVYALAADVLGEREAGIAWLAEPQYGLGGRVPQDLLSSELGRAQVRALLLRIEQGLLA